jgi:RNA polymerase sigma-70 factor (ECF subfamily)
MDAASLGRLLDRHGPALTLYARQWTESPEDIVQEAFVKLVQQRQTPEQVVPWLFRVVRNAALTAARARRRRERHETHAASQTPSWFAPSEGEGLDAEAAARALEALPLEERETIVAHLWGGLSFEEVAVLTGTSSSTAHRRYAAGLASLRERLKAHV